MSYGEQHHTCTRQMSLSQDAHVTLVGRNTVKVLEVLQVNMPAACYGQPSPYHWGSRAAPIPPPSQSWQGLTEQHSIRKAACKLKDS